METFLFSIQSFKEYFCESDNHSANWNYVYSPFINPLYKLKLCVQSLYKSTLQIEIMCTVPLQIHSTNWNYVYSLFNELINLHVLIYPNKLVDTEVDTEQNSHNINPLLFLAVSSNTGELWTLTSMVWTYTYLKLISDEDF